MSFNGWDVPGRDGRGATLQSFKANYPLHRHPREGGDPGGRLVWRVSAFNFNWSMFPIPRPKALARTGFPPARE